MCDYIVSAVFLLKNDRIKIWELSLLLALCICLCQTVLEVGQQNALSEKILRLHVVAASDEDEAQALKKRVRDAVTAAIEPILAEADSAAEAEKLIAENREVILAAARSAAEGEALELRLGRENFTYRESDGYALPAGEYSCLRLIIGEGEGHNWWGVIFPQLTMGAESAEAVNLLSEEELTLIYDEDSVELRFKCLELIEKLRLWLTQER